MQIAETVLKAIQNSGRRGLPVENIYRHLRMARFGGLPLKPRDETFSDPPQNDYIGCKGIDLIQRLLSNQCECCGTTGHVEVHHIRKLIHKQGPLPAHTWMREMITRKRKTLIVCKTCHRGIHSGRRSIPLEANTSGQFSCNKAYHRERSQSS